MREDLINNPNNFKAPEDIALFDMDGTLFDFDQAMNAALEDMRSPSENPLDNAYEDIPHIKARRKYIKSFPGFWRNLPRLENGFNILNVCKNLGFTCHILTKGPAKIAGAYSEKFECLKMHAETKDLPINMVTDKGLVYGRVLVDDWPEYFMRWLEWRPRGLVVCVKQPWNEKVEHPNVVIYNGKNLDEVQDRISKAKFSNALRNL